MKRAQGLSMNLIVMAAIALLILVVLAIIFMGRMGVFGQQVAACKNQGGNCRSVCNTDEVEYGPASDACDTQTRGETPICCLPSPTP